MLRALNDKLDSEIDRIAERTLHMMERAKQKHGRAAKALAYAAAIAAMSFIGAVAFGLL